MTCQKHENKIRDSLRGFKLRATPARLQLLDVFVHAAKPLDAAAVAQALGAQGANLSTVYRNLESLASLGLLKKLGLQSRQAHYELADGFSERSHHHHLICLGCHKVADITDCGIREPRPEAVKAAGFASLCDHSLEFFGYCSSCAKKK